MPNRTAVQSHQAVAAAVAVVDPVRHVGIRTRGFVYIMKTFTGKLALITGGSSGIGLDVAKKLAASGCHVGILARDSVKLEAAAAEIRNARSSSDLKVTMLQVDVSNYEKVTSMIAAWIKTEGVPDLVVNSAGFGHPGLFEDLDMDLFRKMNETNYYGTVHVTKAVLPAMLERGSGHIVYISSVAGFLGMYAYTAYAPTKFAVRGFVDSLRCEVKDRGITLSIVYPPDTETPGLESEKPLQPPLLVALNETAPAIKATVVADSIIQGIQRNRYIITPGSDATLMYQAVGLLGGGLMYNVVDMIIADAVRKLARNKAKYTRQ